MTETPQQPSEERDLVLETIWENSLRMTSTLDEDKSAVTLGYVLMGGLGIVDVGLFLAGHGADCTLTLKRFRGSAPRGDKPQAIRLDGDFYDFLLRNSPIIEHSQVDASLSDNEAWGALQAYQPSYLLPLICNDKLIGLISLGQRLNKQALSGRERHMLTILAACAANTFENTRLYDLAIRDELTNLFIRRHFDQRLEGEIQRAKRHGLKLSVLVMDIDHFKKINDTYGHRQGDEILVAVANKTVEKLRETDIPARYGGEEFTFILPETPKSGALVVAERIRRGIETMVVTGSTAKIQVTTSIGVASYPEDTTNSKELIDFADHALYEAKGTGRNQVKAYRNEQKAVSPRDELIHFLQRTALFVGLEHFQIERILQSARAITYPDGRLIIQEGESGEEIFVIMEGDVDIFQKEDNREVLLNQLRGALHFSSQDMGDFFGEMCLVDVAPRSASARAKGNVKLLKITRDAIYNMFHEDRVMQAIMLTNVARIQGRRLRKANIMDIGHEIRDIP